MACTNIETSSNDTSKSGNRQSDRLVNVGSLATILVLILSRIGLEHLGTVGGSGGRVSMTVERLVACTIKTVITGISLGQIVRVYEAQEKVFMTSAQMRLTVNGIVV
jgi:hypothetical protein